MNPIARLNPSHVTKRLICSLLAIGGVAALVLAAANTFQSGQVPTVSGLVGGMFTLGGTFVFALFAMRGGSNGDTGVLSEPSEKVRNLAIRRDSKIEAVQAYRQETGVDVKRAREVVERLASPSSD